MSNENKKDDLVGFRDFIEKDPANQRTIDKSVHQTFDLLTQLEKEEKRLSRLIELFEDKAHLLENYSQSEKVIKEVNIELEHKKESMAEKISNPKSEFMANISEILKVFIN